MSTLFLRGNSRSLGNQWPCWPARRYARDVPLRRVTQALNRNYCMSRRISDLHSKPRVVQKTSGIEQALAKHSAQAATSSPELRFIRDVFLLSNTRICSQHSRGKACVRNRWQQSPAPSWPNRSRTVFVCFTTARFSQRGRRRSPALPRITELFHELVQERSQRWPQSLNASTTTIQSDPKMSGTHQCSF